MNAIHQHILRFQEKYARRAREPLVAWDCLGAERWAQDLAALAQEVESMSEEQALAHLQALRREADRLPLQGQNSWGLVSTMWHCHKLDELIDPVARECVGWIVLGTHGGLNNGKMSTRPGYRRMLDVNHCVAACGRERDESDEDWLAHRDAWLAQYHPDVPVVRDNRAWSEDRTQYTAFVGTVKSLRATEHLVEPNLVEGLWFRRSNRWPNSLSVVDAGPLGRKDGVLFLARSIPEDGEEGLAPGSVVSTHHGPCEIVA